MFAPSAPHYAALSQAAQEGARNNDGGLKAMEGILTAHPDGNVVFGENVSMVLRARKALEYSGKLNDVPR